MADTKGIESPPAGGGASAAAASASPSVIPASNGGRTFKDRRF